MVAAPTYALPAPQEIEPAPLLKFSFYCFCIFNLVYYCRFFEWQLWYLSAPLAALYAIDVSLSSWRGGSFRTHTRDWLKSLTAFPIAGALVTIVRRCSTWLNSIGFGAAGYRLRIFTHRKDIMKLGIDFNQFRDRLLPREFKKLGFRRILDVVDLVDADRLAPLKRGVTRASRTLPPVRSLLLTFVMPATTFVCQK